MRSIARTLGSRAAGLGDDCALIDTADGTLAWSVDLSIENVHFRRDWLALDEIGWRAAAGALSDLAAVGAEAVGLLASVVAPRQSPSGEVEALMGGVGDAAASVGATVLGGDLSAGPAWMIDVTVLGRTRRAVRRNGAMPGDGVWVTGRLGGARAALVSWQAGVDPEPIPRARFAHPQPRLVAGRWLAAHDAHAMIDLSDGLAGDVRHLASASHVQIAIRLDDLPLEEGVDRASERLNEDPRLFAATGGEDYELLVVMPPGFTHRSALAFEHQVGMPLTLVGRVTTGSGAQLTLNGQPVSLAGFDHFR